MTNLEVLSAERKNQILAELRQPPRVGEVSGLIPTLVLSAWSHRRLFRSYTTEAQKIDIALSLSSQPNFWTPGERDYKEDYLANLSKEDLQGMQLRSILDLLFVSYTSYMSRFDLLIEVGAQMRYISLPERPSQFIRNFMEGAYRTEQNPTGRLSQRYISGVCGLSQSWVSNLLSGDPVRWDNFEDLLSKLLMPEEVKYAALEKYEASQDLTMKGSDRRFQGYAVNLWQAQLSELDSTHLAQNGFSCAEEFLFVRACNTADRLVTACKVIQDSSEDTTLELLRSNLGEKLDMWPLNKLNDRNPVNPREWIMYIDAWAARGLF